MKYGAQSFAGIWPLGAKRTARKQARKQERRAAKTAAGPWIVRLNTGPTVARLAIQSRPQPEDRT